MGDENATLDLKALQVSPRQETHIATPVLHFVIENP